MIVIVGSRHDEVATRLAASWPHAALCSAGDLVQPGWIWHQRKAASRQWVVDGQAIRDRDVTGVFIRRSAVYAEELLTTHGADRHFLAAEATAFLTFVLATTAARVVNPVTSGSFGEDALLPERLAAAATRAGLRMRPVAISSEPRPRRRPRVYEVETAAGEIIGDAPADVLDGVKMIVRALSIRWATFLFDRQHRLVTATTTREPSRAATDVLGRYLQAGRA